ncbi:tryptophan synthase beta subunit-like PLP-dependent enzyme [Aspergillus pseudoustus]|uniref:Tryptophan synthase beta subunit-like PLP-dependent enzyme n=1 Tax=Aspergillus pseudoustus TaxID=1810923 RepID=A0ABR4IZ96_9EURO
MTPSIQEIASAAILAYTRIKPHTIQTPLLPSRTASPNETKLLFKAENFQRTGSFKLRGATAKLSATGTANADRSPTSREIKKTITASSGNHGIGAACAASTLGKHLTVVLPENVVQSKLEKVRSHGADVILHGSEAGLAEQHAQALAATGEYTYLSPYNDAEVIAGQGTVGVEILEQCSSGETNRTSGVHNVFVAMGGGGLISGIGSVMKSLSPQTRVYGVSATSSRALAASMAAGRVVDVEHRETLADAVAGGIDEDSITLQLARGVVDFVVECEEEEIKEALRELAFKEGMVVEGAAALAFAGFRKAIRDEGVMGKTNVVVLCGGNFDEDAIKRVLL